MGLGRCWRKILSRILLGSCLTCTSAERPLRSSVLGAWLPMLWGKGVVMDHGSFVRSLCGRSLPPDWDRMSGGTPRIFDDRALVSLSGGPSLGPPFLSHNM